MKTSDAQQTLPIAYDLHTRTTATRYETADAEHVVSLHPHHNVFQSNCVLATFVGTSFDIEAPLLRSGHTVRRLNRTIGL